jgi:hypothetical protein
MLDDNGDMNVNMETTAVAAHLRRELQLRVAISTEFSVIR